jgi:hypothetical protein
VHRSRRSTHPFGRTIAALAVLQCSAFLCLEIAERVLSGAALNSFAPTLVVVGLLIQIVVAFVVALLLAGLRRIGERLSVPSVAVVRPPSHAVTVLLGSSPSHTPTCDRVRGPPVALAA